MRCPVREGVDTPLAPFHTDEMRTEPTIVATIGYESADLADFIATLRAASVTRLIDVRELAISRRKGFSKRALSGALAQTGIEYVHLRGLGDPKAGRTAAKAGDVARFRRVFTRHMETEIAQADLRTAARLATEGGACLMCYERDHAACHRTIVAEALSDMFPATILHLGVCVGRAITNLSVGQPEIEEERV